MKNFYPNRYYKSKEDIPAKEFYEEGYRGILFDIDNTLVPHDEPVDDAAIQFVEQLKRIGYRICLISNNDEERVRTFADPLGVSYVHKAWKPGKYGYDKGMEIIGTNRTNTLFVGDQIFTDIWGAKRNGIFCILLDPINSKEEIQIVLKRIPEKYIKWRYRKRHNLSAKEYDLGKRIK